LAFKVLKFTGW